MKIIKKYLKFITYKCLYWLFPNDETFLKLTFRMKMGYSLDLNNPTTYNEKLQWLKLHHRKEEYTNLVDKCEAKKIVAKLIGNQHIIPTIGVWNSFDEIDFDSLPQQFVLKCTHDSGGLVICPNKKELHIKEARKKINFSMKNRFYLEGREYPYKNVRPRIIAEQYMEDDAKFNGDGLTDYKIYCCHGKPICILICTDRSKGVKYYYFSPNWEFLRWDKTTQFEPENFTLPKPNNLKEMLDIAEKLSASIPTVRVDLYSIKGKTFFGELTFFSNSGYDVDITRECDEFLGRCLDLSSIS